MRHICSLATTLVFISLIAGCSSVQVNKPLPAARSAAVKYNIVEVTISSRDVPELFLDTLIQTLDRKLRNKVVLDASYATRDVHIEITDYRMRNPTARLMLGVLVGDDHATSSVIVRDSLNHSIIADIDVTSRNVFIFGSEYEVARDHGQDIANALLQGVR